MEWGSSKFVFLFIYIYKAFGSKICVVVFCSLIVLDGFNMFIRWFNDVDGDCSMGF